MPIYLQLYDQSLITSLTPNKTMRTFFARDIQFRMADEMFTALSAEPCNIIPAQTSPKRRQYRVLEIESVKRPLNPHKNFYRKSLSQSN